jgi:hypothetical protein
MRPQGDGPPAPTKPITDERNCTTGIEKAYAEHVRWSLQTYVVVRPAHLQAVAPQVSPTPHSLYVHMLSTSGA